ALADLVRAGDCPAGTDEAGEEAVAGGVVLPALPTGQRLSNGTMVGVHEVPPGAVTDSRLCLAGRDDVAEQQGHEHGSRLRRPLRARWLRQRRTVPRNAFRTEPERRAGHQRGRRAVRFERESACDGAVIDVHWSSLMD